MARENHHPAYYPFLFSVGTAGLTMLVLSVGHMVSERSSYQWVFLALLTVLTSAFPIKMPQINYMLSIEDTFVFTNLIFFGPGAGVVTAALQGIMGSVNAKSVQRRLEFTLFNVSALILAAYLSGEVFFSFPVRPVFGGPPITFVQIAIPTALMALVYYAVNSVSVAIVIALDSRKGVYEIWHQNFSWTWITYITGSIVAAMIALNAKTISLALIVATVPFILVIYFTYRTYRDKVEGQIQQIRELNDLYLRTVE